METELKRVQTDASFPKVSLTEPTGSGYILLGAEVDSRLPFLPASSAKRRLMAKCKRYCAELERLEEVKEAVTFRAALTPPGRGKYLKKRQGKVHVARFDVVILIETVSVESAKALRAGSAFAELETTVREAASCTRIITAGNIRCMGTVAHDRKGVFLFNYFVADDIGQNLAVWDYTAGWFEQETDLDNSTVLLPGEGEDSGYSIINHCRWDRFRDIVPALILKRTFRTYVLANFELNNVAAIPILYRLA